jgi:hypothetical protein
LSQFLSNDTLSFLATKPYTVLISIYDFCLFLQFDWEAAVREIDSACEAVAASTSSWQPHAASMSDTCSKPSSSKMGGKVRQSTLERFVDSFTKRRKGDEGFVQRIRETSVGVSDVQREENSELEHQIPSVAIDPEAAKTWIYPSTFCFLLFACMIGQIPFGS